MKNDVNTFTEVLRNSAAGYLTYDAIIPKGVLAYEEDTGKMKVGDGTKKYSELSYTSTGGEGGGGGGATGKAQLLAEPTGDIESDATTVLVITGGGTYNLPVPAYDGQIILVSVGDGVATTFTGNSATGSDLQTGGNTSFLLGVDMTPFGGSLSWFISV